HLDLAVANFDSETVSVLLGTAMGSFAAATHFDVGPQPFSVAVGDLNGDGHLDLGGGSAGPANLSGVGRRGLGAGQRVAGGAGGVFVTVGDFNGDGHLDLAVANKSSGTVSIRLGSGTGSFGAATNFDVETDPVSIAVGDLNADGHLDVAVANEGADSVSI